MFDNRFRLPLRSLPRTKPRFRNVRERLRFVRTARADYDLRFFPDFMIIGPQRTGTTWLHANLVEHPQVFMPGQKELYYFNNLRGGRHPSGLPPVEAELGWYLDFFRPAREFLKMRNKECRRRFGVRYRPKVLGEATASYAAALDSELIREILVLNPDVKILTMVRDPIERAWSHAKKDLSQLTNRAVEEVREEEWIKFFEHPYQVRCGRYSEFHSRWRSLVKPGHFFVGRFVDLNDDPVGLLMRTCEFLGIEAHEKYAGEQTRLRFNPTESASIPPALRARLEELFGKEVAALRTAGMI